MKWIVPDYYDDFACRMGDCRHSCCIGWEIDIDEESLERYRSVPGEIGEKLRKNIHESSEGACFCLTDEERCPFLNRNGLCDLILNLGEDSLCQICADHPRFRNFFSDREEIGLGLCCEAAGSLILKRSEPVQYRVWAEDGADEQLTEDEAELLNLREDLTRIAQNRSLSMPRRIAEILRFSEIQAMEFRPEYWADFLTELERLDECWTEQLNILRKASEAVSLPDSGKWEVPFEQLLVYLLRRHLPGALDDGDLRGRIAYCALIWRILRCMLAQAANPSLDDMTELCRLYSSEIEYSDENIGAILDELHRLDSTL